MKSLLKTFGIIFLLFLAYLLFFPTGLEALSWTPPQAPALEGQYAQNNTLTQLEIIYPGQCNRCEDIAIDSAGNIYGGEINGNIRFFGNGSAEGTTLTNTGGRPLGLHFDQSGNLIIADAEKGLLSMSKEGQLSTLTDSYGDYQFKFVDDLEIDSNDVIYFTDASNRFGFHDNIKNLLENQSSGAFYSYDPRTKNTTLLIDSMFFANGVAVDHNEQFVLVNETTRYQLRKYWISGSKKGHWEILKDNLPGFPDGISRGEDGIFWLTFASPRVTDLDLILPYPFFRKIMARLPLSLQPAPIHYGIVLGLDQNGNVIHNLQDPDGKFGEITSVQQFGNKLYLGSLYENGIGVFDLDKL